ASAGSSRSTRSTSTSRRRASSSRRARSRSTRSGSSRRRVGAMTRTHPRVRGGYAARYASLVFGLGVFALAIVLILESKLGLSPWDVLNQGLSKHTPLSFGFANVAVGIVVLFVGWSLGGKPGVGTVANAVLVGVFIQGLTSIGALTSLAHEP